jgi:hypothetical protein
MGVTDRVASQGGWFCRRDIRATLLDVAADRFIHRDLITDRTKSIERYWGEPKPTKPGKAVPITPFPPPKRR